MTAEQIIAALIGAEYTVSQKNKNLIDVLRNDYSVSHDIVKVSAQTWQVSKVSVSGYDLKNKIVISPAEIVAFIQKNP